MESSFVEQLHICRVDLGSALGSILVKASEALRECLHGLAGKGVRCDHAESLNGGNSTIRDLGVSPHRRIP